MSELLDENEFLDLDDEFGIHTASEDEIDEDNFFAEMGGEAILTLLSDLDVVGTISELLELIKGKTSVQKRENALKRLRVLKQFDPRIEKKVYNKPRLDGFEYFTSYSSRVKTPCSSGWWAFCSI